ncbi:hypothetical protein BDQ17DRAFT_1327309 [Cyathus striatus]|nr:hypothetical protein BDQ17DRAFT_1327309 [Cyathus striatus]
MYVPSTATTANNSAVGYGTTAPSASLLAHSAMLQSTQPPAPSLPLLCTRIQKHNGEWTHQAFQARRGLSTSCVVNEVDVSYWKVVIILSEEARRRRRTKVKMEKRKQGEGRRGDWGGEVGVKRRKREGKEHEHEGVDVIVENEDRTKGEDEKNKETEKGEDEGDMNDKARNKNCK